MGIREMNPWNSEMSPKMPVLSLILAVVLLSPGAVLADPAASSAAVKLYNCDGVLRNLPCGEKQTISKSSDAERQKRAYLSEKRSLVHNLTMSRLRAKEEYDVDVDIGSARDICNSADSPIEDCRAEAERLQGVIVERTAKLKSVKEKERANALQEEANRLQQERNEIEANKPNVTVIQQYPVVRRPYPPRPYPPGVYPPGVYPPQPNPLPGYPGVGPRPFPPPPVIQGGSGVNIDVNIR